MNDGVVSAFAASGEWFVEITDQESVADRWNEPSALDGYTVGGLVAHTAAAAAWLGPLLDTTAPEDMPVWSVADYLTPFPVRSAEDLERPLHAAARAQGQRGAERGAKETVARLHSSLETLVDRLAAEDPDRLLALQPIFPAAIRLGEFLRTRVVELVVHGDDLAASINVDTTPPRDAAAVAVDALLEVAINTHGHREVLRALARGERLTGRVFPVL